MLNLNEIKGCFDFQEGMLLKDVLLGVVCMSRLCTQNLLEVPRRFPSLMGIGFGELYPNGSTCEF